MARGGRRASHGFHRSQVGDQMRIAQTGQKGAHGVGSALEHEAQQPVIQQARSQT